MPVITRSMTKKMAMAEVVHQQPSEASPLPSITDLPPEVLEMILRNLDCGKNSILPYRLVSPLWKSIIDDLLEKKTLKGDVDGCPTLRTSTEWLTVRCPYKMLHHNGNPFPSSSLIFTRSPPFIYNHIFHLDDLMSKVGSHLTSFIMKRMSLNSTENLCKILAHLPNLKTLNLLCIDIENMEDEETLGSLPALPRLSRLEICSPNAYRSWRNPQFCAWFVDAYADQLQYLELTLSSPTKGKVPPFRSTLLSRSPWQQLRQLKVSYVDGKFLQLSCSAPLLKHLYIGKLQRSEEMNLAVLMTFVGNFSNSLETLNLDIEWSELSHQQNRDGEGDGNQLDKLLKRFYGDDTIPTGGTAPVFPKLTKLTFPYPSNDVESAVINKLMLPKFPALRELKLSYFRRVFGYQNLNKDEFRQIHGPMIKEFLMEEDYWKLCGKLTLISVWHSGEGYFPVYDGDNFLVLSIRREDNEK